MRGTFSLPEKSGLWQVLQRCCCASAWPRCHPRGIAGVGRRRRLRQFGDEVGKGSQVVVGQRLCHLVHRLEDAQLFAEHEELDQRIRRLLRAERGRVFGLRLPASRRGRQDTARRAPRMSPRRRGGRDERKCQGSYCFTHRRRVSRDQLTSSSLRGAKRRSNPDRPLPARWIASLARNDGHALTAPPPSACRR